MTTRPSLGSARTLLLAALAFAAAVIVVSVALMTTRSDDEPSPESGGTSPLVPGGRHKTKTKIDDETETTDPSDPDPGGIVQIPSGSRDPSGDNYVVDGDSVRAVFKIRHWEELRRQIDELQRAGKTVPPDVVKSLIDLLSQVDQRLDVVLVLGGVKDDETGRKLGELAVATTADPEVRKAALDALAKSGQKAALPMLQQLVDAPDADEQYVRHALFALGAIGGADAGHTLLQQLERHQGDDLRDAVMSALGTAGDVDAGMATELRSARDKGDKGKLQTIIVAAQMQGAKAGPEVKAELTRMVESPDTLTGFATEDERLQIVGTALPAAAAAGIVAPVVRLASGGGVLRDVALEALINARGASAAKQIIEALSRASDDVVRWKLTKALGQTADFAATATLVSLLDDPSVNVRDVAAQGLGSIHDGSAVPAMLKHLEKAAPEYTYARNLVESLGLIGANAALPMLQKLAASTDPFWRDQLAPFVKLAINRIKTDNPDSMIEYDGKK